MHPEVSFQDDLNQLIKCVESDEDDKIETRKRDFLNNSVGNDLGQSMLGETTLSGHNRLRTKITQTRKLEDYELPAY